MKKLFTLFLIISCVLSLNAQITESGNGFKETFNYADSTDYVEYGEGLFVEWPEGSMVQEGILNFAVGDSSDGWFGVEFDAPFDLSGNSTMTFKYKFNIGGDSVVNLDLFLMDTDFAEFELYADSVGVIDTWNEITLDLSDAEGVEGGGTIDVSKISLIGIILYTDHAGTFSLDDLLIGDAEIEENPITESGKGFEETFNYTNGTNYVEYVEGLFVEWPEGSIVQDGNLNFTVGDSSDGWFGVEFDAPFDLSGNSTMTFDYKFNIGGDSVVNLDLFLMDTDFAEYELYADSVGVIDTWNEITLDLSDAEGIEGGGTIDVSKISLIGIIFYTDYGGTFSLDDLLIGDAIGSTAIRTHIVQNYLLIYPNPASTDFKIGVDADMVSIFNVAGQVVYSERNYRNGSAINVGQFESGLYIIKADENIQKLIVR